MIKKAKKCMIKWVNLMNTYKNLFWFKNVIFLKFNLKDIR